MTLPPFKAAQGYGSAAAALRSPPGQTQAPQSQAAAAVPASFTAALKEAETVSTAFMTRGADPHSVVEALAAAELAVETASVVRDKVVEAYQELLRMPV